MNSSGIKRGLATVAVSALAISGLGAFAGSAHAVSIDSVQGGASNVNFYTQDGVGASIANDGANTTVSLVAGGGTDVKKVRFTYSIGGGAAQEIAVVDRVNGAFSAQWTPPSNVLGGAVELKAVGLDAAGVAIPGATDTNNPVAVAGASKAIAIGAAAGSSVGAYPIPGGTTTAIVSGTTDVAAAGDISDLNNVVVGTPNASGIRTFSGVQDLGAYVFSAGPGAVNEAVLHAATPGSDDAVPVKVYEQTVASITAVPASATVATGTTTSVVVTVKDQNGAPIAGALVALTATPGTQYSTDANGQYTVASVGAGSLTVHVDTDGANGYNSSIDYQATATVTAYAPALTTVTSSATKTAYDRDELAVGDVKVVAKDQNGATFTGATDLKAAWDFVPFAGAGNGTAATVAATITGGNVSLPTGPASDQGTYTLRAWNESDGTPGQGAGEKSAAALAIKVGQASVKWDAPNSNVQAAAGTDVVVNGKVALVDGTELPGRTVTVNLATGGNAALAPTVAQPAGVTVVAGVATVVTKADGTFSVKVSDPAAVAPAPQPTELNVTVSAAVPGVTGANLDLDFQDLAVDKTLFGTANLFNGMATPGRPVEYTGTVTNAAGDPVNNAAVNLSLDKGFFVQTDSNGLVPDVAPAAGGVWGDWAQAGTTKSVTTDANGKFEVVVGIEKDVDFDDDGLAKVTLTSVVGGKTNSADVTFESSNALNVGSVELVHDADQDVKVLPKAPTRKNVGVNVFATDQFGNLTDAMVNLKDNKADANINGSGAAIVPVWSQFTNSNPVVWLDSATAGDQALSGHVAGGDKNTWNDATPAPAPARTWVRLDGPNNAVSAESAALTTEWYVVNLEAGSYELTHNGAALNPVGSLVKVTYTAKDQNGNPIEDVDVDFFRAGPTDNPLDGIFGPTTGDTNVNGQVSFTFQGKGAGNAVISTLAVDDWSGDDIIAGEKTVTIKFGAAQPPVTPPAAVTAKLVGANNGKKADRLTLTTAPAAKGSLVKLQALNAKGKWVTVATKSLSGLGNASFKVSDNNGTKKTSYRVKVAKTVTTKAAVSNTKKVK